MPFGRKRKTKEPESQSHAYEYCIFMLGLRLYTEGELRTKMQERGYVPDVIENVLEDLKSRAYVDDDRFVENYIDNAKRYKTYGYYMLKKKLLEKKLPGSFIEQKLDEFFLPEEELEIAERYLEKQRLTLEGLEYEEKQKIAGKLRSRGFRSDTVHKVLFTPNN